MFDGVFLNEPFYKFQHPKPKRLGRLKIYETHIGMAGKEERLHTYSEFAEKVLPRVKKLGYNCIQIMAIKEHSLYSSFGY